MTIACKLWLLAVVGTAFLYQDGPQGNGVLCVKKVEHLSKDNSSGDILSEENNSSSEDDLDGSGMASDIKDSNEDDDDDDDDDERGIKSKKGSQKSKNKNDYDDEDDEDSEDEEDEEDEEDGEDENSADSSDEDYEKNKGLHKNIRHKINNKNRIGEMQMSTITIITGKPEDILNYLNADIMPYQPAALNFKNKSNSKLLKKIKSATTRTKSSKGKKEPNEDLKNYMRLIFNKSSKNKNNKQIDSDEILMTILKSTLLHLLKNI